MAYIATTDASAYVWFSASSIAVGDLIEIEMYQPDGKYWFNGSGSFDPTTASGNYCFTWRFDVAGALPATVTGKWKAHATINSNTFFDFSFDILPPGSGGGGGGGGGGTTGANLIPGGNAEQTTAFEGCRPAEVATQVGLAEDAVRQRKSRLLRRLAEKLNASAVTNPDLVTTLQRRSIPGTAP